MKSKIAILGSTGSIGKTLLDIIIKDRSNFEIILLTANKDYKTLYSQARKFNVKNIIITNPKSFKILKKKLCKSNIKIYQSFKDFNKIFTKKIDYVMNSIVGIEGLYPTIKIIKFTKKIAIANKESIICGWNLISKELTKYKTQFIPVDSEHFCIWYGLQGQSVNNIENIYITASGGPFRMLSIKKFERINVRQATNHPNWKMGKKISVDSSNIINKVYEVIEAKNIFNIPYKKINIIVHPKSYIHTVLKFYNGLINIIAHDTTMKIPIFNSIYFDLNKKLTSKKLNFEVLNNLKFHKPNLKRYPMLKILKMLPNNISLFETVIVSANDTLVNLFLENKIKYMDITRKLFQILKMQEFVKFKKINPKNVDDILDLNKYVRLKVLKIVYKS